jgi:hypothetical protein
VGIFVSLVTSEAVHPDAATHDRRMLLGGGAAAD